MKWIRFVLNQIVLHTNSHWCFEIRQPYSKQKGGCTQ